MNAFFLHIINTSISAGWLILAVLILRLILRRSPKWICVLLWGLVAVRLICPFSIESALSLIPSAETVPMNIEMSPSPAIDSGINAVDRIVSPVLSASFAPDPLCSANPLQIWIPILGILWAVGVAVFVLYAAVSYWRLQRNVREAVIL
ncbi:MAG: peptidase M56, partial [Oscillospiraceae bacterium]|nr:peptidase M56 [Oscillospiraceae bacterium]